MLENVVDTYSVSNGTLKQILLVAHNSLDHFLDKIKNSVILADWSYFDDTKNRRAFFQELAVKLSIIKLLSPYIYSFRYYQDG